MFTKKSLMLSASLFVCFSALADNMTITPNGSQHSINGSEEYFSGGLPRIDPLFATPRPQSNVTGAYVTFNPGTRSAWHTHPVGQTLVVTTGTGWVQEWGKEKKTITPGDVVWCPPGVKHWHGATSTTGMTHLAIQEHKADGKNVEWLEKVSDTQYLD